MTARSRPLPARRLHHDGRWFVIGASTVPREGHQHYTEGSWRGSFPAGYSLLLCRAVLHSTPFTATNCGRRTAPMPERAGEGHQSRYRERLLFPPPSCRMALLSLSATTQAEQSCGRARRNAAGRFGCRTSVPEHEFQPLLVDRRERHPLLRSIYSCDGVELWRSDGSQAGTVMVADIFPGLNSSQSLISGQPQRDDVLCGRRWHQRDRAVEERDADADRSRHRTERMRRRRVLRASSASAARFHFKPRRSSREPKARSRR